MRGLWQYKCKCKYLSVLIFQVYYEPQCGSGIFSLDHAGKNTNLWIFFGCDKMRWGCYYSKIDMINIFFSLSFFFLSFGRWLRRTQWREILVGEKFVVYVLGKQWLRAYEPARQQLRCRHRRHLRRVEKIMGVTSLFNGIDRFWMVPDHKEEPSTTKNTRVFLKMSVTMSSNLGQHKPLSAVSRVKKKNNRVLFTLWL